MNIIGEVKDKNVILYDDMVDTAAACAGAKALVEMNKDLRVRDHGVLSGTAIKNKQQLYKRVVFTTPPVSVKRSIRRSNILHRLRFSPKLLKESMRKYRFRRFSDNNA